MPRPQIERTKKFRRSCLSSRVMALCIENWHKWEEDGEEKEELFDWAAYIDAVPGINHDDEEAAVASRGEKLPRSIALAIFPYMYDEKGKYRKW